MKQDLNVEQEHNICYYALLLNISLPTGKPKLIRAERSNTDFTIKVCALILKRVTCQHIILSKKKSHNVSVQHEISIYVCMY